MIRIGVNLRFYTWKDDLFCGVLSFMKYLSEKESGYAYKIYVDKEIEDSCILFFQGTVVKICGVATLATRKEYNKILERDGINILQVYGRNATVEAMKKISSVYVCDEIDELLFPRYYSFVSRYRKQKQVNSLLEVATEVICGNDLSLNYAKAIVGTKKSCCKIFPAFNFRYSADLPEDNLSRVRRKYNLPSTFALTVCDINRLHNVRIIAKALRFTDCNWVLVGNPSPRYIGKILKTLHRYNILHKVRILTHIDDEDIPVLYRMCSVVLLPFKGDSSVYPVMNALCSNKPMVVSSSLCYGSILDDGAYFVPFGDIDGWADAITWLVSDVVLREDLLQHYAEIKKQFRLEQIGEKWLNLYEKMIKN